MMSDDILFTRQAANKIEPISTERRRKTLNHIIKRPESSSGGEFELEPIAKNHERSTSSSNRNDINNISQNIPIAPPIPIPPNLNRIITSTSKKISLVQKYITSLDYNHTTIKFFSLRRDRGMNHLIRMAKRIIYDSLPIQCVEGVFLGVYLTNDMTETILRIPVSFKSRMMKNLLGETTTTTEEEEEEHGHLVLLIRHKRKWGAIGMSRIKTLMDKEIKYDSLFSILQEFRKSYEECCHDVIHLSLGLPFTTGPGADFPIQWSVLRLNLDGGGEEAWSPSMEEVLRHYEKDCVRIMEYYVKNGILPDCCDDYKKGRIGEGGGKKRGRRRVDLK